MIISMQPVRIMCVVSLCFCRDDDDSDDNDDTDDNDDNDNVDDDNDDDDETRRTQWSSRELHHNDRLGHGGGDGVDESSLAGR